MGDEQVMQVAQRRPQVPRCCPVVRAAQTCRRAALLHRPLAMERHQHVPLRRGSWLLIPQRPATFRKLASAHQLHPHLMLSLPLHQRQHGSRKFAEMFRTIAIQLELAQQQRLPLFRSGTQRLSVPFRLVLHLQIATAHLTVHHHHHLRLLLRLHQLPRLPSLRSQRRKYPHLAHHRPYFSAHLWRYAQGMTTGLPPCLRRAMPPSLAAKFGLAARTPQCPRLSSRASNRT